MRAAQQLQGTITRKASCKFGSCLRHGGYVSCQKCFTGTSSSRVLQLYYSTCDCLTAVTQPGFIGACGCATTIEIFNNIEHLLILKI